MSRWLVALAALVGGAIGAASVTAALIVAIYAMLWLFVFGDDTWPAWVRPVLDGSMPVLAIILWAVFGRAIWRGLRRQPDLRQT